MRMTRKGVFKEEFRKEITHSNEDSPMLISAKGFYVIVALTALLYVDLMIIFAIKIVFEWIKLRNVER